MVDSIGTDKLTFVAYASNLHLPCTETWISPNQHNLFGSRVSIDLSTRPLPFDLLLAMENLINLMETI